MKPTEKHPQIDKFLAEVTGVDRKACITQLICTFCNKEVTGFRNQISEQEYRISGLCQECQDETFGRD